MARYQVPYPMSKDNTGLTQIASLPVYSNREDAEIHAYMLWMDHADYGFKVFKVLKEDLYYVVPKEGGWVDNNGVLDSYYQPAHGPREPREEVA
jgi:hypothetical protein